MLKSATYRLMLCNSLMLCWFALAGCDVSLSPEEGMNRAEAYSAQGNFGSAVIELKNVMQSNPNYQKARLMLGDIYLILREGDNAANQFYKIRDAEPDIRSRMAKALLLKGDYYNAVTEISFNDSDSAAVKSELMALRALGYFYINDQTHAEQWLNQSMQISQGNITALIGLAMLELKKGDYDASNQHVEQILANDPENLDALIIKGKIALVNAQYELADQAFKRVISVSETKHEFTFLPPLQAYIYLVQSLVDQKRLSEARQTIRKLKTVNPEYAMINYLQALVSYESGETGKALEKIQVFRAQMPDFDQGQILEGVIQFASGHSKRGDTALSEYIENHPGSDIAGKYLAASYLNSGQFERSYKMTSSLLNQDPDNAELLLLASSALIGLGDTEAGIALVEKALAQDPENINIKIKLAKARLSNGEADKAIVMLQALPSTVGGFGAREILLIEAWSSTDDFETALIFINDYLALHPKDPVALGYSGILLQHMGKMTEARAAYEKAISLKPGSTAVLMRLALLELKEKKYTAARLLLDDALKLDPANADAMYMQAKISLQRGEGRQAITWLERAVEVSDTVLEPRMILVKFYLDRGDITSAKKVSSEATRLAPKRADVWSVYSVVQIRSGDMQGAVDSLRKAEALEPKSEVILLNLANTLVATGDVAAATRTLDKLLKISPQNFKAAATLALLEFKNGSKAQAFNIAKKQQAFKDNRLDALVLEGNLHRMQGDYKKAVNAYRTAADIYMDAGLCMKIYTASRQAKLNAPEHILIDWLKANPKDMTIRLALIRHYEGEKDAVNVIKQYEILVQQRSGDANLLNNLALAYFSHNNTKAVPTAEKAYSLNKNSASIQDTLGWMLVNEGGIKRGLVLLRNASVLLPNDFDVIFHYAVALDKSGNRESARRKLLKIVDSTVKFSSRQEAKSYLDTL